MHKYLKKSLFSRLIAIVLSVSIALSGSGLGIGGICYAQGEPSLPSVAQLLPVSAAYNPVTLKGIKFYPNEPFKLEFILDEGNTTLADSQLKEEANRLVRYFLCALTLPARDIWVNLSPYEANRIVADDLSTTEMGRDLLAQDYMLKQLSASLTYPETELGKKYWQSVNNQANFNKVWIMPDKSEVYESGTKAIITESSLKVMTEEDYSAMEQNFSGGRDVIHHVSKTQDAINRVSTTESFKQIILPEITKDVNTGKNFARLRQLHSAIVLAAWFKTRLKDSLYEQLYLDKKKTNGLILEDKSLKDKIYNQYVEAFKKGAYNYIKKETTGAGTGSPARGSVYVPGTKIVKRQYFSGGVVDNPSIIATSGDDQGIAPRLGKTFKGTSAVILLAALAGTSAVMLGGEGKSGAQPFGNRTPASYGIDAYKPDPYGIRHGLDAYKPVEEPGHAQDKSAKNKDGFYKLDYVLKRGIVPVGDIYPYARNVRKGVFDVVEHPYLVVRHIYGNVAETKTFSGTLAQVLAAIDAEAAKEDGYFKDDPECAERLKREARDREKKNRSIIPPNADPGKPRKSNVTIIVNPLRKGHASQDSNAPIASFGIALHGFEGDTLEDHEQLHIDSQARTVIADIVGQLHLQPIMVYREDREVKMYDIFGAVQKAGGKITLNNGKTRLYITYSNARNAPHGAVALLAIEDDRILEPFAGRGSYQPWVCGKDTGDIAHERKEFRDWYEYVLTPNGLGDTIATRADIDNGLMGQRIDSYGQSSLKAYFELSNKKWQFHMNALQAERQARLSAIDQEIINKRRQLKPQNRTASSMPVAILNKDIDALIAKKDEVQANITLRLHEAQTALKRVENEYTPVRVALEIKELRRQVSILSKDIITLRQTNPARVSGKQKERIELKKRMLWLLRLKKGQSDHGNPVFALKIAGGRIGSIATLAALSAVVSGCATFAGENQSVQPAELEAKADAPQLDELQPLPFLPKPPNVVDTTDIAGKVARERTFSGSLEGVLAAIDGAAKSGFFKDDPSFADVVRNAARKLASDLAKAGKKGKTTVTVRPLQIGGAFPRADVPQLAPGPNSGTITDLSKSPRMLDLDDPKAVKARAKALERISDMTVQLIHELKSTKLSVYTFILSIPAQKGKNIDTTYMIPRKDYAILLKFLESIANGKTVTITPSDEHGLDTSTKALTEVLNALVSGTVTFPIFYLNKLDGVQVYIGMSSSGSLDGIAFVVNPKSVAIAENGAVGNTRQVHDQYEQKIGLTPNNTDAGIINKLAQEKNIPKRFKKINGAYVEIWDYVGALDDPARNDVETMPDGTRRMETGHGWISLGKDRLLRILDDRLEGGHVSRGTYQRALWGRTAGSLAHEESENASLEEYAIRNEIATREDIDNGLLGAKVDAYLGALVINPLAYTSFIIAKWKRHLKALKVQGKVEGWDEATLDGKFHEAQNAMLNDLRLSLEENPFSANYQPSLTVATGRDEDATDGGVTEKELTVKLKGDGTRVAMVKGVPLNIQGFTGFDFTISQMKRNQTGEQLVMTSAI